MSIATEGIGGTHFVTKGYGYTTVVVLPSRGKGRFRKILRRPRKPRKIKIPQEHFLSLLDLGIIGKYEKEIELHSLSLEKVKEISLLLSELNIKLPVGLEVLLNELKIAAKKPYEEISIKDLNIIREKTSVHQVNALAIAKEIRQEIEVQIPDIYKLKIKELMKLYELLDLLEKLDK